MSLSPEAARWFLDRRGIRLETLEAFGVSSDGEAVTFPYGSAKKYRKGFEKEGRRFWWDPPTMAGQVPFLPPDFEPGTHMVLLEGETDTMSAWQAATDAWKPHIVGLSGLNAWKDRYAEELFGSAKKVFVVFDNDDPYSPAKEQGDKSWQQIRSALGRKARRVVLPQGINDVAEFFQQYDWAAFHTLLKRAGQPKRNYPRLNLNQEVPETDWVIEDLLVANEATAVVADGGVGKSMIAMAASLAVAGGDPTFLDLAVRKHGPVLYVDEENSQQLALQRFHALGYDPKKHKDLEYIWYAGVDLLNEPEKLLEDAQEIEPALVVVDSLSRVALGIKSENDNAEMSRLMRLGVIPIARETGAAVLVVHHTSAQGTGPRGATAIRNSADQVISIIAAENAQKVKTGKLNIFPSKPRRQTSHIQARIVGDIENEGWARVERAEEEDPF